MKQVFIGAMLTVFIGLLLVTPPASAEQPSSPVEHLNETLLSVMKEAQELGFKGRYQRLFPVVTEEFDLPFIARYTLGSHWDKLSEEQRHQFLEIFQELSVADYARHFDGYDGEHFTIEEEASLPRGGMRVRSKLVVPTNSDVIFDYLLHEVDSQWRIVNVIADGVSDLAVKRAEYRYIMKTEGFNSLLDKLKEKIELYRNQADT